MTTLMMPNLLSRRRTSSKATVRLPSKVVTPEKRDAYLAKNHNINEAKAVIGDDTDGTSQDDELVKADKNGDDNKDTGKKDDKGNDKKPDKGQDKKSAEPIRTVDLDMFH